MKPEIIRALSRVEYMIEGLRNPEAERVVRLNEDVLDLDLMVSDLKSVMKAKTALLRCEGNATQLSLMLDQHKLIRAFQNLIFNSVEAGAREVVIRSNSDGYGYRVDVIDNGPGVPTSFISKLFTEGESLGKDNGTGLGLSSVKRTIEAHDGTIVYERLSEQTVFTIYLPSLNSNISAIVSCSSLESNFFTRKLNRVFHKPRVIIDLSQKDRNLELKKHFIKMGYENVSIPSDMRLGDVVYTDSEIIFNLALKNKITVLLSQPNENKQSIIKAVNDRLDAMRFIWKRQQNEN